MFARPVRFALLSAASLALAAPALAQPSLPPLPQPGVVDAQGHVYDGPMPDNRPQWQGQAPMAQPGYDQAAWQQARADWLTECRRRHGNGNMVGGAVVGGLIGGVIGNQVVGRGDRVLGTVAGAAVGAVAGGAIGGAADQHAARDYCEAYLDQYTTQVPAYGQQILGYGYQPMMVMVPVAYVAVAGPAQQQQRECQETIVTEEWVAVPPPHHRYIPPRPRPDKRVRIVPDKRVRVN